MEQSGILISLIRLMQASAQRRRQDLNGMEERREMRSRAKIMYDVMHLAPAKTSIDPESRSRILGDFLKIQQGSRQSWQICPQPWPSSMSCLLPSVQVDTTHCHYTELEDEV